MSNLVLSFVLEDDPPTVRRPARAHVGDGFGLVAGELAGIVSLEVHRPDAALALPRRVEGDVFSVRRERRVVGVPHEPRLLARAEVEDPDVPVPEGAEDVTRLELAPRARGA
jgi:hypothetical protein